MKDDRRSISAPYPAPATDTDFFWASGADGMLRFQRCQGCRYFLHPPVPRCPQCLSDKIAVEAVSGHATILAKTINRHPWHPAFPPPYVIAIVEIAEAPHVRLTTRIVTAAPESIAVGDRVQVRFERLGLVWVPLFAPVAR